MKVKQIMTCPAEVVSPDAPLKEAAQKMRDLNIGALPVCEGAQVVGILTDRDLAIRAFAEGLDSQTARVKDVFTREVALCHEDEEVSETEMRMQQQRVRRLAVLDRENRLVGMLTLGDLATRHNERCGVARTLQVISEAHQEF